MGYNQLSLQLMASTDTFGPSSKAFQAGCYVDL